MGRFIREGDVIDVTLHADCNAGVVSVIENLIAVAKEPYSEGDFVSFTIVGVFEFDTEVAISQGERVYWHAPSEKATADDGDVTLGIAMTDAEDGKVHVKINV